MAPSRGVLLKGLPRSFQCPQKFPWRPRSPRTCPQAISSRSFHASRPRQSLLETSIATVHGGITFLHTTVGLPWVVALPLTAILLRSVVVLPLQIVAQRNRNQDVMIAKSTILFRPELERKVMEKYRHLGPERCTAMLSIELAKKQSELRKEAGLSRWPQAAPLLQLPVWLLAIETIRRMVGASNGLLGILAGGASLDKQAVATGAGSAKAATAASSSDEELLAAANASMKGDDTLMDALIAKEDAAALATQGTTGTALVPSSASEVPMSEVGTALANNPFFEPSLSTGGALWFPNLLVPDPHLLLSFGLGAALYGSVAWEERRMRLLGLTRSRLSVAWTRGIKLVALAIGPMTLNLPAAMLVYWLTSASTALAQKTVVDMIVPPPQRVPSPPEDISVQPDQQAFSKGAPPPKKKYVPLRKPSRKR